MNHLSIKKPCSENWQTMSPTERGAFCSLCRKEVIDFTNQSSEEIRNTLFENRGNEVCARITNDQLNTLNLDFESWQRSNTWTQQQTAFYAFLLIIGLSLASCTPQTVKENNIDQIKRKVEQMIDEEQKEQGPILEPITLEVTKPIATDEDTLAEEVNLTYYVKAEEVHGIVEIPYDIHRGDISMLGAMVYIKQYDEYLIDVVPKEQRDSLGNLLPTEFNALVYPNPTNGPATLKLEAPEKTDVTISIFDLQGNYIYGLTDRKSFRAGIHEINFDLSDQPAGTYLVALISAQYKETIRIVKQ